MWEYSFFISAILLGVGLSMDAFSVSLANGFNEPNMRKIKIFSISALFGFLQGIMPLIGWLLVHIIVDKFLLFQKFIPYIALVLLFYIGGKMILEFFEDKDNQEKNKKNLTFLTVLIQGIATSIDSLSVGFTISNYGPLKAFTSSIIIAIITFIMCLVGCFIGKQFGTKFAKKASLIGGIILVLIGIEIFIRGV